MLKCITKEENTKKIKKIKKTFNLNFQSLNNFN